VLIGLVLPEDGGGNIL